MAKSVSVDNRKRMWVFGKCIDFHIVSTNKRDATTRQVLGAEDYRHPQNSYDPERHQKTQIVLHCTAGNNPAESTITDWNSGLDDNGKLKVASAHFVIERTTAGHAKRPELPGGVGKPDRDDAAFVDVVRVMDDDTVTYHGESVNSCSIGIEIANASFDFRVANSKHYTNEPSMEKGDSLPKDENRYIHLPSKRGSNIISGDYQAYEEEQYSTLILFLRHLCITHCIPRIFLGNTTEEMYKPFLWRHTDNDDARRRSNGERIYHFRGILHHRNVNNPKDKTRKDKNTHKDIIDPTTNKPKLFPSSPKSCPGILNRNRLFRGIIDNWWLPVDIDGSVRTYYSGPFNPPAWDPKKPKAKTKNAYFRPSDDRGSLKGNVYKDADIEALSEAKHYFNLGNTDLYYAIIESRLGGCFPVASNMMWHGGVHLPVPDTNPWVYAAASGTIVAARMNPTDTPTDAEFGSQRFILIRHVVYPYVKADPDFPLKKDKNDTMGTGMRINYTEEEKRDKNDNPTNPVYIFSLYMHMAPVEDATKEVDGNPPWFNVWRRKNANVDIDLKKDRGVVFNPDIEVSVGDILGKGGTFRGNRVLHFEIIGHRENELKITHNNPFTNSAPEDTNDDAVCTAEKITKLITDIDKDGNIDRVDILRASSKMRDVKVLHLSEWALSRESQIIPLVKNEEKRKKFWPHLYRFSWFDEAVAANPALKKQLGEKGIFWHYHPITFMKYMNELIHAENAERREDECTPAGSSPKTNVEIDDQSYFSRFITWDKANKTFISRNSSGKLLVPNEFSASGYGFTFDDNSIACQRCAPNSHKKTHLSVGLLEIAERIQCYLKDPKSPREIKIVNGFLCSQHLDPTSICVLNNAAAIKEHSNGVAVDISPKTSPPAQDDCVAIWQGVKYVVDGLMDNLAEDNLNGDILQNEFPVGYCGVFYSTTPAIAQKLNAKPPQKLDPAELKSFAIHLSLGTSSAVETESGGGADASGDLWVKITNIKVINDEDWFGSAEWELNATINGKSCPIYKNDRVNDGDTLTMPQTWCQKVEIGNPRTKEILVEIGGKEKDLLFDDDLGVAKIRFDAKSSPGWGVGTHVIKSSSGDFEATVTIGSHSPVSIPQGNDDILPMGDSEIVGKIKEQLPGHVSTGF